MQILISLLVLGILVFVHELGHFVTAKLSKMPVSEFSIGMGPSVYSYTGEKTVYSFRAIPVGGFVNIEGMEVDSELEDGFNNKKPILKFIVLFAGVFMNFLFAFILIFGSTMVAGNYVQNTAPVVGEVIENSKIKNIILPKDKIIKINNIPIKEWTDISATINSEAKANILRLNVELERGREKKIVNLDVMKDPSSDRFVIGIVPEFFKVKIGLKDGFIKSVNLTGKMFKDIFKGLGALISGKVKKDDISGPIGIIKVLGSASKEGMGILAYLTAMLSINLGILNLLPIPAMDGGRILFVLWEIIGIKISKKTEERVHYVGMIMLFALMFFITVNDVFNLLK
ncbi:MAG: site-2 protease family protein [Fusobacteriaceae bacterium]|jgi:regulator of sigma E protease|nr:site-2 protease family protein [Fusobacteriaceae bacterium]